MVISVLIIDPDIDFAVRVRQALEQAGEFKVRLFVTPRPALDHLSAERPDVAVVDFNLRDMTIAQFLADVRKIHPDLPIIVTPRTKDHLSQLASLGTYSSLGKPYFARQLTPLLREALGEPESTELVIPAPPVRNVILNRIFPEAHFTPSPSSLIDSPEYSPVSKPVQPDDAFNRLSESVVVDQTGKFAPITHSINTPETPDTRHDEQATPAEVVSNQSDQDSSDLDLVDIKTISANADAPNTLQSLIDDEPELPEGATIRDLVTGSIPVEFLGDPIDDQAEVVVIHAPTTGELGSANSTSLPPDELPESGISSDSGEIQPRGIDPDLLADLMADISLELEDMSLIAEAALEVSEDPDIPLEDTSVLQVMKKADIEKAERGFTDGLKLVPKWATKILNQSSEASSSSQLSENATGSDGADDSQITQLPESTEPLEAADSPIDSDSIVATPELISEEEPIAILAVQLTQLTVDSTAKATLLTRGDKLIASAGVIARAALESVAETINRIWSGDTGSGAAIIRYIKIPEVDEFLLYSSRTVEGMRLSMLFSPETPVKTIRRQALKLAESLENSPEVVHADDQTPEPAKTLLSRPTQPRSPDGLKQAIEASAIGDAGHSEVASVEDTASEVEFLPYTFLWLARGPIIPANVAESLPEWLEEIAVDHDWDLHHVEVFDQHVIVNISAAPNVAPPALVEALMFDTADRIGEVDVWADGYLAVASDRELTPQEVADFLDFQKDILPPPLNN